MNNFTYHVYTDVRFGKDQINTLPELVAPLGKKILLVYGGGSIKKNGIYDKVHELLSGCEIFELSGKITSMLDIFYFPFSFYLVFF